MQEIATKTLNRPVWVDVAVSDAEAARDFYSNLFGWQWEVNPDPQYGGYGRAKLAGSDAAGLGPKQSPEQPTAWTLYIGTDDIEGLAERVTQAGGTVIAPPFDVGDQGRMAVFQDPTGAFISAWQTTRMSGFATTGANAFGWAELNTRDIDRAISFYQQVFGWSPRQSPTAEGQPPYTEFLVDGESIAGAWTMPPEIPAEVPPYWLIYFSTREVDAKAQKARELGGTVIVEPQDIPNGRFAVVTDPQGATFGLLDYRTPDA